MFCRGGCGKEFDINLIYKESRPHLSGVALYTCGEEACIVAAPVLMAEADRKEAEEKARVREENRRLNGLGEFKRGPGRPPKEKVIEEPKPQVARACEWCEEELPNHNGLGRPSAYCNGDCREKGRLVRSALRAIFELKNRGLQVSKLKEMFGGI